MANKIKNIKKDHEEENEVEITMELNNQNNLTSRQNVKRYYKKRKLKF